MKLEDLHGKYIKQISWEETAPDKNGTTVYHRRKPAAHEKMRLSFEYYGDHAEIWVVIEKIGTGEEIERFSTKNIDQIEWE